MWVPQTDPRQPKGGHRTFIGCAAPRAPHALTILVLAVHVKRAAGAGPFRNLPSCAEEKCALSHHAKQEP
jgi:hypothetical protein